MCFFFGVSLVTLVVMFQDGTAHKLPQSYKHVIYGFEML